MNTMSGSGAGGGGGNKKCKEDKASVLKFYSLRGPVTGKVTRNFTDYLNSKIEFPHVTFAHRKYSIGQRGRF